MKCLKYLLLSLVLIQSIFVFFLPIPFLGLIVRFSLVPLAHLVSWKELFEINLIGNTIDAAKAIPQLVFGISLMESILGPQIMQYVSPQMILGAILFSQLFQVFVTSFLGVALQKAFYYLLPKKLKIERIGY